MVTFLQLLVSGIGMGCIYCMVAIEYTLIWNASGLVNFGHEKFIMLGAYIFAGTLMLKLGVPSGAAILITILIMFLFGADCRRRVQPAQPPELQHFCSHGHADAFRGSE